jgi:SAM-dependent methyltransferase
MEIKSSIAIKETSCVISLPATVRAIDAPRFLILQKFLTDAPGLNIGSQEISFNNKLNVDITTRRSAPNILASVTHLPFADESFEEIVFTEVLEHTPIGTEVQSLQEISRVLKNRGRLLMSVPNNVRISKLLDFVYWTHGHRHYSQKQIEAFLLHTQLKVLTAFSAGMIPFGVLTFPYMINFLLRRQKCDLLSNQVKRAYNAGSIGNTGGTLFVIAMKVI